eukprot:CAMPEP_0176415686 /NCGR_PEP_ID=MMETSP0127-20121128/5940_1 /TAXON_ID=938130 /ORGANISM="Platyophrya macrostoma, Strain WH" /LENGTH=153 /DNA_ID=CAMNT_0017795701 /DNA_START=176 /DNA_END=637 /DNA_ORIENTATION=+
MVNSYDSASEKKTVFHAKRAPKVSLHAYIARIAEYTKCSDYCLMMALIYLDRVSQLNDDFNLDPLNIHRLSLIAITTAAKYTDEFYYTNSWYAEVGGIDVKEFNVLEKEFLINFINFKLFVNEETYENFVQMTKKFYLEKIKKTKSATETKRH